jgi:hypothetical protein
LVLVRASYKLSKKRGWEFLVEIVEEKMRETGRSHVQGR